MPQPPIVTALYLPPKDHRRPRSMARPTYSLQLVRDGDGRVLHRWSGIPHDKVAPLLRAMHDYLPWLAKAAAAKQALAKLLDLFH